MKRASVLKALLVIVVLVWSPTVQAQQASAERFLIHMKTSLAEDDAQICAVPNVAWAAVKAGHKVTILVDASAVTSVTKGFGLFTVFSAQAVPHWIVPHSRNANAKVSPNRWACRWSRSPTITYGEYFEFLKNTLRVEIYGNRTMTLLYKIEPARVASAVTLIPLERMVQLLVEADRIIVY